MQHNTFNLNYQGKIFHYYPFTSLGYLIFSPLSQGMSHGKTQ